MIAITVGMAHIGRSEAIARIKKALRVRTGRAWRVFGSTGTAYGWINIKAPACRAAGNNPEYGDLNEQDAALLGAIFKKGRAAHFQGVSIAPESREWHVAAAEGRLQPCADGNGWEIVPEIQAA